VSRPVWIAAAALAGAAGIAWLTPAYLAWSSLPAETTRFGVDLVLSGIRPIWPLGFRAESAQLRARDAGIQLGGLRAVWSGGSGVLGTAQLASGTLELRTSLGGGSGLLFARAIPLQALEALRKQGIALRGQVTAVASWDRDVRFSARVDGGSVTWLGGILGARTKHISILGEWRADEQLTRIDQLEAFGPSFDLTGSGEISAQGELELQLEVQRVDDRLVRALRVLGIPPPRQYPARYALVGPWQRARLELLE
jgi:hypothetical protein